MAALRLGIFGGTFDPPHVGHLVLAAESLHQLKLDRVLWVLTPDPPHKKNLCITTLETRLEMLQACLQDAPEFYLSRVDIERPAPHYALDTMRLLAEEYPGADLVYLMGSDSLHELPAWHKPLEFIRQCKSIGVMHRPGDLTRLDEVESQLPGVSLKVRWVLAPLLEIASSDIRQRAAGGRPFRFFLPPPVYELIQKHHLYR
jgi:nicotinate-nucleotide adenylyltransferase